jgi:class 3 adenylate cyclase/tetratricopeptide (TPR) repeat protein
VITCPACGQENPERARFCLDCGAPLTEARGSQPEERKVVTVLFCDLVGFTAASHEADPEDVRARLRPYHQLLRTEIRRYGGTVEKFIGDAGMAVFGAPVAHEDDAERAVRAGLRIVEAIEDLNAEDPGIDLNVRVGINTGEAVVVLGASPELGEGIVAGDVVNTASRLQGAAPTNGVAVGEHTYLSTREIFDYEQLEPVALKGKSEAVLIWQATAAKAGLGTDIMHAHRTPPVGRELETTLLEGTLARTLRDRTVHLVTIVGEPGVGKSRQVAELFRHVDERPEPIRWRQGRCLPYGEGITFWALGEIVKAESGILESDPPDAAIDKLEPTIRSGDPDREWLKLRLLPLLGIASIPVEREENFTAWRRFLEHLAADLPSVFVLEDLHWADPALLAFIEHVVEYAEGVPMLLVCTARPELFERQANWGGGKRNSTIISLSRLTDPEIGELVSELLGQTGLPDAVMATIVDLADGNPLYGEEFVRLLRDRGDLVRVGATWQLADAAEIILPESVQSLIAARLDTLPTERKAMLQDAAVVGKVFWSGAVAEMGGFDEKEVVEAMHELSRKELVRPARTSSMLGEQELAFWHVLVRDVCYGQIPRAARAAKHRAAAAWIERLAAGRIEDLAEILAYHYGEALEHARLAGSTDETEALRASAVRFHALAGDRALGLDAAGAEAHYAKALDLAGPANDRRPELLGRWAEALVQRGRFEEAAAAFEEAIEGFQARGDRLAAGNTMVSLVLALWRSDWNRAADIIAEAIHILESEPPGPELVAAFADMSADRATAGAFEEAKAWGQRALDLAAELGLPEAARALGFRGLARVYTGDAEGIVDIRRAIDLAVSQGLGRAAALQYFNLGYALWLTEGPTSALWVCQEGVGFAERRGIDEFVLSGSAFELALLEELGRWDQVIELGSRLEERAQAAASVWDLLIIRGTLLLVRTHRGELSEAARLKDLVVSAAKEMRLPEVCVLGFGAAAATSSAIGRSDLALELLEEFECTPWARSAWYYPAGLPGAVRIALAAGDVALATRLGEGVEPLYALQEHALLTTRALLAEHEGDHEAAADLFADLAARWEGLRFAWEQAQALLGRSRCALALGEPDATEPLNKAREIFARLGAKPAVAATDALLERATALTL